MNFEVAEKALQYLEAEPRRFDMKVGIMRTEDICFAGVEPQDLPNLLDGQPPCGTICCFAGAVVVSHDHLALPLTEPLGWPFTKSRAAEVLDISIGQAGALFYIESWPVNFRIDYQKARNQSERVVALRAFIESLKEKAA